MELKKIIKAVLPQFLVQFIQEYKISIENSERCLKEMRDLVLSYQTISLQNSHLYPLNQDG